ncbi:MAG: hypothetical protein QM817_41365 [Archangium sp.]
MPWVVEQAKLKSTCEECHRPISKGDWRFGKNGAKARWFHLRCGSRGAPQMFPPFAAQVKKLLAGQPDESRPLSEVERSMVAKFDSQGLPVLADWLTSKGDPWGELITLRLAGEDELAVEHFDRHRDSLLGDMPADELDWCDGVVSRACVVGSGPAFLESLQALLSWRTAARVDTLGLVGKAIDVEALKLLSTRAPSTLAWLMIDGSTSASALEALSLPHLERLRLVVNVESLPGLLKARLPKLRQLVLQSRKPLPVPFLEALVSSRLFSQLKHFEIEEDGPVGGTLDDAGFRVLLDAKTSHLDTTYVELAGRALTPEQKALAKKKFGPSNARFLKNPPEEPEFDEF